MSKRRYYRISREDFVKTRYERFLISKEAFKGFDDLIYLTDLDKVYPPFEKPMKEVVICDCCNEDIEEETLVSLENSRLYHEKCAATYPNFDLKPETPPVSYDNVISLFMEADEPDEKEK